MKHLTTILLVVASIHTTSSIAQGTNKPVSATLDNYVNAFDGSFSYQVPLMTVPGPNGEAFPLSLSYRAGIGVEQEASWIGLGWEMQLGEISRSVNGVADDWSDREVKNYKLSKTGGNYNQTSDNRFYYGPLYFGEYNYLPFLNSDSPKATAMDIYSSYFGLPKKSFSYGFQFADYDQYFVSSPGVNGEIYPHLFDYASLHAAPQDEDNMVYAPNKLFTTLNNYQIYDLNSFNNYERFEDWYGYTNPVLVESKKRRPAFHLLGADLAQVKAPRPLNFNNAKQHIDHSMTHGMDNFTQWLDPTSKAVNFKLDFDLTTVQSLINRVFDIIEPISANALRIKALSFYPDYYDNQYNQDTLYGHPPFYWNEIKPYLDDLRTVKTLPSGIRASLITREQYNHIKNKFNTTTGITTDFNFSVNSLNAELTATYNAVTFNAITLMKQRIMQKYSDFIANQPSSFHDNQYNWSEIEPFFLDIRDNYFELDTADTTTECIETELIDDLQFKLIKGWFQGTEGVDHLDHHGNLYSFTDASNRKYYTNRIESQQYIEFFTVQEVNESWPIQGNGTFYKYNDANFTYAGNNRDIAGFKVTDKNGMTYHFNLPVYVNSSSTHVFDLNEQATQLTSTNKNLAFDKANVSQRGAYVSSWKLTAITGPTYTDANNDGKVGMGDKGYWINIHYNKWTGDFASRSPYYGYNADLASLPREVKNKVDKVNLLYSPKGSTAYANRELYYPDYVQTASHTAFFITDVKADGHSIEVGGKAVPKLKLTDVILLKNDQVNALNLFNKKAVLAAADYNSSIDWTKVDGRTGFNKSFYDANKVQIDQVLLARAELTQSNKLAQKLYNNFNTSATEYPVNININGMGNNHEMLMEANGIAGGETSGKLTLKKVKLYGKQGFADAPAYEFDYNENLYNPDYSHTKTTYYGFYNNSNSAYSYAPGNTLTNVNGGYVSSGTEAYSMNTIHTPAGATIQLEYEPHVVEHTQYEGRADHDKSIYQTFRIDQSTLYYDDNNDVLSFKLLDNDGLTLLSLGNTSNINTVDLGVFYGLRIKPIRQIAPSSVTLNGTTVQVSGVVLTTNTPDFVTEYKKDEDGYSFITLKLKSIKAGGVRVKEIKIKDKDASNSYVHAYTYKNGVAPALPKKFSNGRTLDYEAQGRTLTLSNVFSDRHAPPTSVGYSEVLTQDIGLNNKVNGTTKREFSNYDYLWSIDNYGDIYKSTYYSEFSLAHKSMNSRGVLKKETILDNHGAELKSTEFIYNVNQNVSFVGEAMYYNIGDKRATDQTSMNVVKYVGLPEFYRSINVKEYRFNTLNTIITKEFGIETVEKYRDYDRGTQVALRNETKANGIKRTHKKELFNNALLTDHQWGQPHKLVRVHGTQMEVNDELVVQKKTEFALKRNTLGFTPVKGSFTGAIQPTINPLHIGEVQELPKKGWTTITTLFNVHNTPLEQFNPVFDVYNATKENGDCSKVIAQASNTNYASFTYSGFESTLTDLYGASLGDTYYEGEIKKGSNASAVNTKAKTGKWSLKVDPQTTAYSTTPKYKVHYRVQNNYLQDIGATDPVYNKQGTSTVNNTVEILPVGTIKTGILPGRKYKVSVWVQGEVNKAGVTVRLIQHNGTTTVHPFKITSSSVTFNDWKLVEGIVDVPSTFNFGSNGYLEVNLVNSGNTAAYFDDLIFKPFNAVVNAVVYDQDMGFPLVKIQDDNYHVRYVYDQVGRQYEVYTQDSDGEHLMKKTIYQNLNDN